MTRNFWICPSLLLLLPPTWCQSGYYKYVYSDEKSWVEAQAFCREYHTDLATMETVAKVVNETWIGLYQDREDKLWKWSMGDELMNDSYWGPGEPTNNARCGLLLPGSARWASDDCRSKHAFMCCDGDSAAGKENSTGEEGGLESVGGMGDGLELVGGEEDGDLVDGEENKTEEEMEKDKDFLLVKENKTWEEALEHCRSLGVGNLRGSSSHYDLATLISPADHTNAHVKAQEATSDEVWTGLRFLAGGWWWVGGEEVLYPDIQSCSPIEACGVLEKRGTASFQIRACEERKNFICYRKL